MHAEMSSRDWFAGNAIVALGDNSAVSTRGIPWLADHAYMVADAIMARRADHETAGCDLIQSAAWRSGPEQILTLRNMGTGMTDDQGNVRDAYVVQTDQRQYLTSLEFVAKDVEALRVRDHKGLFVFSREKTASGRGYYRLSHVDDAEPMKRKPRKKKKEEPTSSGEGHDVEQKDSALGRRDGHGQQPAVLVAPHHTPRAHHRKPRVLRVDLPRLQRLEA